MSWLQGLQLSPISETKKPGSQTLHKDAERQLEQLLIRALQGVHIPELLKSPIRLFWKRGGAYPIFHYVQEMFFVQVEQTAIQGTHALPFLK
jgi:hypothetical protein